MESLHQQIDEFLKFHSQEIRPIVCVTSGGTIVPLSTSWNPSIDNFSVGERGANSVEYFLAKGYVVIFLHRLEAKFPFSKNVHHHFSDRINHELMCKIIHEYDDESGTSTLQLQDSHLSSRQKELVQLEGKILRNVLKYRYFLPLPFQTIQEYLSLLEYLGKSLAFFGPRVCFYLAAAVSDFYIPSNELAVQEDFDRREEEELVLPLQQVPKMLGVLSKEWAPNAFVISFKLETDENILLQKAQKAIEKYGVHLVVANLLHERRNTCILVSRKDAGGSKSPLNNESVLASEYIRRDQSHQLFIEKQLIESIIDKHRHFIHQKYESYFQYTNPKTIEDEKRHNAELLNQLLEKIYDQEKSLICLQIQYYLTHTNSKESEEQKTSLAFLPAISTHDHHQKKTSPSKKVYRRRFEPLIRGVFILVGITAIKVFLGNE